MLIEKNISIFSFFFGVAIFTLLFYKNLLVTSKVDLLLDKTIVITGPMLGFLIALKGILLSNNNKKIIQAIKDAGKNSLLNTYLKRAIQHTAILLFISMFYILSDFSDEIVSYFFSYRIIFLIFWLSVFLMTIASITRFVTLFLTIIDD